MPGPSHRKQCPDFAAILQSTPANASIREQVAQCFHQEMARAARTQCQDDVLAEDVAQEALRIGLERLESYRGDAPLWHWLRRLIVSACARLRRGKINAPHANLPLHLVPDTPEPAHVPPPQEIRTLLKERLGLLHSALQEVPEPNRSLLILHEGQDVPLTELASRFGLTTCSVKSRLKRTRAALRKRLISLAAEET